MKDVMCALVGSGGAGSGEATGLLFQELNLMTPNVSDSTWLYTCQRGRERERKREC